MTWKIDSSHSLAEFSVRHMMVSNVKGRFDQINGQFEFDEADHTAAKVEVSIPVSTITTRDEKRDGHLISPDFFDAAQFPEITFKSTGVEKTGENIFKINGDLTMHGITKPVVLDAEYNGQGTNPWGAKTIGFSATTTINRKDFGLNWNVALETGGVLVGENIKISLEVEGNLQAAEQAA
jgi:polyisoprenoid-binding protein YceI